MCFFRKKNFAHDSVNVSRLKFIFTSSVASAVSWDTSQGPYPEETILDARSAIGNGYGESKYVSERVFLFYFALFYFWLIIDFLSSLLKLASMFAP
jgi:nucleoside-diphosphate-sugar epimerase